MCYFMLSIYRALHRFFHIKVSLLVITGLVQRQRMKICELKSMLVRIKFLFS